MPPLFKRLDEPPEAKKCSCRLERIVVSVPCSITQTVEYSQSACVHSHPGLCLACMLQDAESDYQ